jgi:DNA polymerase
MRNEKEPGAVFALGNIGWLDFESKSTVPIADGSDKYSHAAQAIILAWASGDGEVHTESVADFSGALRWQDMPAQLHQMISRVLDGTMILCAHNASFDRQIWNNATVGFPKLEPWHFIDTRIQATAAGLPPDLATAAKYATKVRKLESGKKLITLFCLPMSTATPQTHPDQWAEFLSYAAGDIVAMRELFQYTLQLPLAEWKEYWAAEAANDIGISIDCDLADAAAHMAIEDKKISTRDLLRLTDGQVQTVDSVKTLKAWLHAVLPEDCRSIMEVKFSPTGEVDDEGNPVVDEEGNPVTKAELSLLRGRVERMIVYLEAHKPLPAPLQAALRVLQIRLYGGSKTPAKFAKMLRSQVDGIIRHQYVFGGASQTGRFSARGIQVHNLMRDALDDEIDAIDALVEGVTPEDFDDGQAPISRKLSMLIRPTLVAKRGHAFIWSDWANIEARILPWIAKDPEADARLKVFEAVDRGDEKFDIYTRTAAEISNVAVEAVDKKMRQRGKVIELACGFGGGMNALLAMAAGYRMHLTNDEAKAGVTRWREAHPWALRLWGKDSDRDGAYGLWGAACTAMRVPGRTIRVGRVGYVYMRENLGGTLMCRLPSGRYLSYRKIRWEDQEQHDDERDPEKITGYRRELMYSRDHYRMKLWHGTLCENIVQATAADILRGTLLRLREHESHTWMPVRLHTHDEVLVEAPEEYASEAREILHATMVEGFRWSEGLPLAADTTVGRWYSKSERSWGL